MPVVDGLKSDSEKFAGASRTYSIEALMGDGRALQAGTSHNLGQNFAKAFEIKFQGRDKTRAARLDDVVGRVDAPDRRRHHDARRRQRPRAAAARRAVSGRDRADSARQLEGDRAAEGRGDSRRARRAQGVRVKLDATEENSPGWKFAEWELRGVPLRLEIGPKDIEKAQVFSARRDTREKAAIPMADLADARAGAARGDSGAICSRARRRSARSTRREASTLGRVHSARWKAGPASSSRAGAAAPSARPQIKAETQATLRNIPLGSPRVDGAVRQVQRRRRRSKPGSRRRTRDAEAQRLLSSRSSHVFAKFQSRVTVSSETSSTTAISGTLSPAKNRISTTRALR